MFEPGRLLLVTVLDIESVLHDFAVQSIPACRGAAKMEPERGRAVSDAALDREPFCEYDLLGLCSTETDSDALI